MVGDTGKAPPTTASQKRKASGKGLRMRESNLIFMGYGRLGRKSKIVEKRKLSELNGAIRKLSED
jgi:hypothetical protein